MSAQTDNKFDQVFVTAEEAIAAYKNGEMLILTDDEDRENEGDLVIAADFATPEAINFMALHGRGLICMSITEKRAAELSLAAMAPENTALMGTAFTVSVDAVSGTTTGISAADRAETIRQMNAPYCKPADLARPGHVFPLIAQNGGVLSRPGHTEAVVDLSRAAGLSPAGVLCEILNIDGSMSRLPSLMTLAEEHHLKIASVADLVAYRKRNEKLILEAARAALPTPFGEFQIVVFENIFDPQETHTALIKGNISQSITPLVRVHSSCFTGDIFGSRRCDCGTQLETALQQISDAGQGIVIYLNQEGRGIGLVNKIRAYQLQENGMDTVEANQQLGFAPDEREYWFAAQILKELGVMSVRLLTNNPRKVEGLSEMGIDVAERLPLIIKENPENARYLHTKSHKMGHFLLKSSLKS